MSPLRKTLLASIAFAMLCLASTSVARADTIIFQSALPNSVNSGGGYSLAGNQYPQYLGARFSVATNTQVTQIGGNIGTNAIGTNATLFGVIVQLNSPTGYPSGSPFTSGEVVASTTFTAPNPFDPNFLTPLNTTLTAGNYALIFGAGQFGSPATANGYMANNSTDLPGSSYISWNGGSYWGSANLSGSRFVVMGDPTLTATPEPATMILLGTGLAGIAAQARRKGRTKTGAEA
jgi:hypothetical protein